MNVKEFEKAGKKVAVTQAFERVVKSVKDPSFLESDGYIEIVARSKKGYARASVAMRGEEVQKVEAAFEKLLADTKAEIEEKYGVTF